MEFGATQEDIDRILKTLNDAKQYSGLGPDDPAVIDLERIMLAKVAELEAAKTEAAPALAAVSSDSPPVLFAAMEEEAAPAPSQPPKRP